MAETSPFKRRDVGSSPIASTMQLSFNGSGRGASNSGMPVRFLLAAPRFSSMTCSTSGQVLCLSSRKSRVRIPYTSPSCACRLTDSRRHPPKVEIEVRFLARAPVCSGRLAAKALVLQTRNRGFESLPEHHFCSCRPVARTAARLAADLSSSLSGNTTHRGVGPGAGPQASNLMTRVRIPHPAPPSRTRCPSRCAELRIIDYSSQVIK